MASEAGKGSSQRPTDYDSYSANYDRIFGKKKRETVEMPGTIGSAKLIFKDNHERSDGISTNPPVDQG
jgi:hypothetical protein